jgi:hypothetical protein
MNMCNTMVFQCVSMWVAYDGFQLKDWENMFILPHILIATFLHVPQPLLPTNIMNMIHYQSTIMLPPLTW